MAHTLDLSSFAGMVFNPIQFINRAFASAKNKREEEFVNDSVVRLQVFMKELNNSLDATSSKVDAAVPQVMQDANTMQREFTYLQEKLLGLEKHVLDVEDRTGSYTESLQQIDSMKSKLEKATAMVKQMEKWTDLAESLESLTANRDLLYYKKEKLKEVADKARSIHKSLDGMTDYPDYDDKKLQLERIYNRLESSISDPFQEALKRMDKDKTSAYMELYASMQRSGAASRSWRRAAADHMVRCWAREPDHDQRALTRLLMEEAVKQVEWLTNVIKPEDPPEELMRLHTSVLRSLDPSLTKIMKTKFKKCKTPHNKIQLLTSLKRDIDDWIRGFKSVLKNVGQSPTLMNPTLVQEFGCASYAPLKELLPKFADVQTQVFLEHLKELSFDEKKKEKKEDGKEVEEEEEDLVNDLEGNSQAILRAAKECPTWLQDSYHNGLFIAGSAIYPYYAIGVEAFASAFLDLINSHSRYIETRFLKSVKSGKETGVFSQTFPASLVLEKAIDLLLDAFSEIQENKIEKFENLGPLTDIRTYLLDEELRKMPKAPPKSIAGFRRAKDTIKALARTILRNPIDVELDKIPQLSVWYNNDALSTDLPDFALSPQEYITEIGQYLMTLPQHLEMHLSENEEPLQFLNELCVHTCDMYAEKILNIRNMDALGTKRCLTDIAYLSSVVEDLGSKITPSLKNLEKSLRAATPASPNEN